MTTVMPITGFRTFTVNWSEVIFVEVKRVGELKQDEVSLYSISEACVRRKVCVCV